MIEEIKTMYKLKLEIGISHVGNSYTYAPLKAGIENISEAMNYVVNKYQFMSGDGWGNTHVTGAHPEWTATGKRIFGDPAQDYIFGLKDKFGADRDTMLRVTIVDSSSGSSVTKSWVQPVTISDIQEWSGATTDDSSISITIASNGKPTSENAAPLADLLVVSVAGSTSGKTSIYVNPVVSGATYRYKTAASVTLPALGAAVGSWGDGAYTPGTQITATTGNYIAVVEKDANGNAVRGGIAVVTSA